MTVAITLAGGALAASPATAAGTTRRADHGVKAVGVAGPRIATTTIRNNLDDGIHLRNLTGGLVQSNLVTLSDVGIRVADASVGVTLDANDARGNAGTDCIDTSTGPNTWTNSNQGDGASGTAVC